MRIRVKILISIIILLFCACSFLSIDKTDSLRVNKGTLVDAKNYPEINTAVISGKVNLTQSFEKKQQLILIVAQLISSTDNKKNNYHYVILDHTKEFILYVPEGEYYLYAISDLNNDFIYQDRETIAVYGKPDKISINANTIRNDIVLDIKDDTYTGKSYPDGFSLQYDFNSIEYISSNGQIKKVYSEIFSYDNAKIGLWHPSLFMKSFGANIYLPSEYTHDKIPVLFVHGAQGTPYDFAYFNVRLTNTAFQPMYFYYPSGMRLPMLSELLYLKIKELKDRYKFKKLYVVAHSMGGLVARAMITNYYKDTDSFIKLFITFATPWSGFDTADTALKTSPYILPSWIDVSAHSMFIKTSLRRSIPESIDYYLFFGKWDKTSKERALDSRVYTEAKGIFGFNADHDTILTEKEVFEKLFEIINTKTIVK
jgi:pimeloyl-ACP methyl ester carboxylesterase